LNKGEKEHISAGFWRRLAAAWVDAFLVYALAKFIIALAAIAGIRIAFEPLFIVLGAAYGSLLLSRWRQTIGKILLGLAVFTKAGQEPSLKNILLREVLGKWGIAVIAPFILGRCIAGHGWVPTVYDALIVLPLLLLLFVHYLIAKRTWYDRLAGTTVERVSRSPQRARLAFVTLMGVAVLGIGTLVIEFVVRGWIPCRLSLFYSMRPTAPYVAFLEKKQAKPVDYVINLFDQHDVVLLCERPHPEASQWDFIYELVSDPRFINRVGHVFTEYGQVGMQPYMDDFMATDGLSPDEIHERAVHIMRNWAVWPIWNNTNFYTYLTRLYALNQTLPPENRIHHHFTDMSVNWSGLTREQYLAYRSSLGNRDEQMAQVVIDEMERLAESASSPPKCLVVMNYRHGFDLTGRSPDAQRINTYEYLKDSFGGRAANVLLNTNFLLAVPIAGGVWDAAFRQTGDRPAGFDFAGSPFGKDPFDIFPFQPEIRGKLTYSDVFKGFLYLHPLKDQYLQKGIPGYFEGFEQEALRRAGFLGEQFKLGIASMIASGADQDTPDKMMMPHRYIECLLELFLLSLMIVGLLIGIGAFITGHRRRAEHSRRSTQKPY